MAADSTPNTPNMTTSLVFLHLSDIHFGLHSDGHYDVDADLRRGIERDVARVLPELPGPVTAIAVSGDIAFSGRDEEYAVAKRWLDRLCEIASCDSQDVLVVPGNHDIHRPTTKLGDHPLLRKELRTCKVSEIDANLQQFLPGNHGFFEPLSGFNSFAARYGCNIGPDAVYWERRFTLNDGSALRWRGMTTTLVSDARDDREKAPMVLGQFQCQIPIEDGISNVVIAHHPPEWLRDQDTAADHLRNRTFLQLYGHKHRQRIYSTEDSIVVSAGAVHPERHELGWSPCYNIITTSVTEGLRRQLCISVRQRSWDAAATRFGSGQIYERSFDLPPWSPDPASLAVARGGEDRPSPEQGPTEHFTMPPDQNSHRRLVWGFHSPEIGFATKMAILSNLQLISDDDQGATTLEIFDRAFSRAASRRQLGSLWDRVDSELGGTLGENPFAREGG